MDTDLYTVVKSVLMPPGGLILLFLLGFLMVRGVLGRVFLFIGLTLLTLMSLPKVANTLVTGLESHPALSVGDLLSVDANAILILGAGRYSWAPEYGGDTVGSKTLQRLRYGVFLHRQTGLPLYVTGGSPPHEDPPLGRLMQAVLESEYGVTVSGVEDRSRTTDENAKLSMSMLQRDGVDHVLLVTHAWHMPRSMGAFERAGIKATPAPTSFIHRESRDDEGTYRDWLPSATAFITSYYGLHEWIGQAWYGLKASREWTHDGIRRRDG
jgi:uncharacterized SAM-binding protein YcdF (DUF218 family)